MFSSHRSDPATPSPGVADTGIPSQDIDRAFLLRSMLTDLRWCGDPRLRQRLQQALRMELAGECTPASADARVSDHEIARYVEYRRWCRLQALLNDWPDTAGHGSREEFEAARLAESGAAMAPGRPR